MRYFTNELWSKINSNLQEERDEAEIEWDRNRDAYGIIFETIKTRFSQKFMKIYLNNCYFHDFHIKNIVLTHKEYGFKNPVSLEIHIMNGIDTFKITYKCVKKFNVDYAEGKDWQGRRGFDDWGYDEFLPIDEEIISHEILFASGASILIHFKKGNIFITKEK